MALDHILELAARSCGEQIAVTEASNSARLTYSGLHRLSDRVRDRLTTLGVVPGDRIGLYVRKSIDAVAAIYGILKAGAAYVPVDPTAPASRNAFIHSDCGVKAVLVERRFEASYRAELAALGAGPRVLVLDAVGGGSALAQLLDQLDVATPAAPSRTIAACDDDLAYVLYTSGSTGKPKGVMLSHANAMSFVDWCSNIFRPQPTDVFSSHAPFHFDLSIFDLYLPVKHGARLVLIGEEASKDPLALAKIIAAHRISIWYSAPSILSLIAQFGGIMEHDFSSLRTIVFAGEVFPIVHLRSLKRQVPQPRYFNLYGPTETNVCTYYEIPNTIPEDRMDPYPIGKVCENLQGKVVDPAGNELPDGAEGELCISGPNVMQGYWNLPEQTAASFLTVGSDAKRWYKTGDIVMQEATGDFRYVGRRDRMVKKRGYRVELGEIEACLYRNSAIREVAVVALPDAAAGVKIIAHLSLRSEKPPSLIALKTFCSQHLPLYMVPDAFGFHDRLPKTSTDKIDYQTLKNLNTIQT